MFLSGIAGLVRRVTWNCMLLSLVALLFWWFLFCRNTDEGLEEKLKFDDFHLVY